MKPFNHLLPLRLAVAVILIMHSVPGMFDGGVRAFGEGYLNQVGFAPFGVVFAWAIKLSHVVNAVCLILGKYVKLSSVPTLLILVAGIVMLHFQEGWFVVGGGRNGMEFNFLLIIALLTVMFSTSVRDSSPVSA
jgi:putative oxidoreductase